MNDLQNKIDYYLKNPGERDIITNKCFHYVQNNYNMDMLFSKLLLNQYD